ncbi:MAG: hypothetical protein K0S53_1551 [Bacteroidetes bacterium]|nr:hypothetical protein [Bacteroidota bacterium]
MFEYPHNENAVSYSLYLAIDSASDKTNFKSCLYHVYTDKTPATRVSRLPLGKDYKWYIEMQLKTGEKINSSIHYFSILSTRYNDTLYYKRKINYNKRDKIQDGIIWCDFTHCAFDREGNLVWFMPTTNIEYVETNRIRDLRFQPDGTITFIKNPFAIHTTMDVKEIWKAPNSGPNVEKFKDGYHHGFEKLKNGNYMVLAYDYVELEKANKNDTVSNKVELVNLIEFNPKGEITWIWQMRDHFPLDILAIPKMASGREIINAHCNAFSIDKENKFIYIGYRDISRIIKIDRKTKRIVASYGKKLNAADTLVNETDIFCMQHNTTVLANNDIMVVNNNESRKGKISSLEIFEQPKTLKDKITSKWSFKFNFDLLNEGKSLKLGNVKMMSNGNLLINEGSSNRIVEITKDKEILWDMMIYRKDSLKGKWIDFGQYKIDFSTSLYPYYFTIGTSKKADNKMVVSVFNEGDFKDSYSYELYNDTKNRKEVFKQTAVIKSQDKSFITLNLNPTDRYTLKVISVTSGIEKSQALN